MPSANTFADGTPNPKAGSPADWVRDLARTGVLAEYVKVASRAESPWLYHGAFTIVWPVVFERLTRRVEFQRGHPRCAQSMLHLEPDCLDLFEDDVDAVIRHLFSKARMPILNLEGWITSRLTAATVDSHRRRRGARGALQRPRLPGWLIKALDGDPWLTTLAVEMLVWVGIPVTVGASLWPVDAWAERRASNTGDRVGADAAILADIDTVLTAMRSKPSWYDRFVERPLGYKQAPLAVGEVETGHDRQYLALTERHEQDDARLLELAVQAVSAIKARLGRREDPRVVVAEVLSTVFGSGAGAEQMDLVPGTGPDEEELVAGLVNDPESLTRIVEAVLTLISGR